VHPSFRAELKWFPTPGNPEPQITRAVASPVPQVKQSQKGLKPPAAISLAISEAARLARGLWHRSTVPVVPMQFLPSGIQRLH
jgi:hypothetical protein